MILPRISRLQLPKKENYEDYSKLKLDDDKEAEDGYKYNRYFGKVNSIAFATCGNVNRASTVFFVGQPA